MRDAIVGDKVNIVGNSNLAIADSGTGVVIGVWDETQEDTAVYITIDGCPSDNEGVGFIYEQVDLEVIG